MQGTLLHAPNKARHDKLVSLVERILELHKHRPRLSQEKESLQREIEPAADGRIDKLIYELSHKGMIYELSEEEIKIVDMYNVADHYARPLHFEVRKLLAFVF